MSQTAMEDGRDPNWKYALMAMHWYGWGSPVGLGLLVLEIAAAAALLRYAFG